MQHGGRFPNRNRDNFYNGFGHNRIQRNLRNLGHEARNFPEYDLLPIQGPLFV
jgi:hypothetical protein